MERASIACYLAVAAIATFALAVIADRPDPDRAAERAVGCIMPERVDARYVELERLAALGRTATLASERFEALIAARMIDSELGGTRERELDEAVRLVASAAADDYERHGDVDAASQARAIGAGTDGVIRTH